MWGLGLTSGNWAGLVLVVGAGVGGVVGVFWRVGVGFSRRWFGLFAGGFFGVWVRRVGGMRCTVWVWSF